MATARLVRIRARKRKKVPSRAVRWARSPQTPRAVELTYVLALKKLAARWGTRAQELLLPIARRVIGPADDTRTDADSPYGGALKSLGGYGTAYADGTEFATAQISTAKKNVAHSKGEFQRLGIKLRQAEPALDKGIRAWRSDNVALVKSMLDTQREILSDILTGYEGHSYETIAKQIEDRCGVVSSRAEFIARDQVLKLNSNITTARMAAAGIAEFVWTTTGDERVRKTHEDLDGQTFSYDDPPVTNDDGDTNLPGEDYQCRCVPTPVLPELDDEAGNDNSVDDDSK
jgi:SPP1 gp7 family putative phage head morphogenesis protein